MSTAGCNDWEDGFEWRRSAPRARSLAMALYAWREPGWTFLWSVAAAALFALAAIFAPALLSLSPTVEMIAPVAEARAVSAGAVRLADSDAPFYLLLLTAADLFVDAPGRIHLVAKAMGALIIAYPLAYFASSRFPIAQSIVLTAGLAAYVSAPFAGPAELGLALLLVCAVAFIAPSADAAFGRARFEGVLAGVLMFCMWLLHPAFALAGFVLLSICPFLSGACGLLRYAATLVCFAAFAGVAEYFAPGLNMTRAAGATDVLRFGTGFSGQDAGLGLSGVVFSMAIVLASAAIFGGRAYRRGWIAAGAVALIAFIAARMAGADALPAFILASGLACFSVASPFYDGLFRRHDRASVCAGLTAACLTLFWSAAMIMHAAGQFALQHQTAAAAADDIRTELALVQPGGPTVAKWVEEGRFSTPEARKYFALSPIDQSAMLLEASERAREMAQAGVEVAILAGADIACVIADRRRCRADGPAAATRANVVFVPRLELDPATTQAKGRTEALLYTEFKLAEQTPFWEIWVRRETPPTPGFADAPLDPPGR